jgi:DNA mismatch repair protein MutS
METMGHEGKASVDRLTPLWAQYQAIKREHQDIVLLFRLGDFYEMFGEDAKVASKELDLVLTSREIGKGRRIPMCGIPYHALDRYLGRLLAKGLKAAICDQMEDPRQARGLVRREVTRILTPGTVVEDYLLDERRNNFLAGVACEEGRAGLALADGSTGDFFVTQMEGPNCIERLAEELSRLQPSEIIAPQDVSDQQLMERLEALAPGRVTALDGGTFALTSPRDALLKHFGTTSLHGFGCEDMPLGVVAAAGVLHYLQETHRSALQQIRGLTTYSLSEFMTLDAPTRRNLELVESLREGTREHSLLWLLDATCTAAGARMLRRWVIAPLLDPAEISRRQDAVEAFVNNALLRAQVRDALKPMHDMERLTARAAANAATARDLLALRDSLRLLPELGEALSGDEAAPVRDAAGEISQETLDDLRPVLEKALADDPPATLKESGLIREGYSEELDSLRQASKGAKDWIASLEQKERGRTGVKSLKVGFNQVFGYYIEVSKPNLRLVPQDYIRKQTIANAERFITPDLKEYEARVLGAEERICDLEYNIFCSVRAQVAGRSSEIQALARTLATIDVLAALAEVAARNRYVRPQVHDGEMIDIRSARHPVVEVTQTDERFVPNDAYLDCSDHQVIVLTGPNMAGKSTYLRQVALICLMAQMGSFVPADSASVATVDRIFTRVGASDDLAAGRSTFMVEMNETANILHNATRRSLVILDEIGRGTSTFDGLSIAWAVAEFIHNSPRMGAKTLFATHYHQLNELEKTLPRVKNYRVAVKEEGGRIIFLRKIVPGGTDRSYGIEVARLAGLPAEVIERAKQVLWTIEQGNSMGMLQRGKALNVPAPIPVTQLRLFEGASDPLVEELQALELENLTPLQALNKLAELQAKARGRRASAGEEKK